MKLSLIINTQKNPNPKMLITSYTGSLFQLTKKVKSVEILLELFDD